MSWVLAYWSDRRAISQTKHDSSRATATATVMRIASAGCPSGGEQTGHSHEDPSDDVVGAAPCAVAQVGDLQAVPRSGQPVAATSMPGPATSPVDRHPR
jgi:hypothetical protein